MELTDQTDSSGNNPKAEIMLGIDFYDELRWAIPQAQDRILVQTMALRPDDTTNSLFKAIAERASSDDRVRTMVQADTITKLVRPGPVPMPYWWPGEQVSGDYIGRMQQVQGSIDFMKESGVGFRWLGEAGLLKKVLPLWNIAHIKAVIIDDTAYLSGPNLGEPNLMDAADTVAKVQDSKLADTLDRLLFSEQEPAIDEPIRVQGVGTVFIDDGHSRTSQISSLTNRIIEESTSEVLMAAKFRPGRTLFNALKQARDNGASVDYVCNQHSTQNILHRAHDRLAGRRSDSESDLSFIRRQSTDSKEIFGRIHAPLILADDTLVVATSVYDVLCEKSKMQELALFTRESYLVHQGREMFKAIFPKSDTLEEIAY
jgi:phosphatidylserine/phosphatidylglycerophosphate/cardiolipin synthase-like enzyme